MKLLTAKEIKKIVIGVVLSDGHIDVKGQRFDFYSKEEEYAKYVYNVISQITGMYVTFKVKHDKRGYTGYRVLTRKHAYWKNLGGKFYNGRKEINIYTSKRIDAEALAHIWMCDGYLEHAKNHKLDKVQNVGWLCLEAFPAQELELLQRQMETMGIGSSLVRKPWGFGYRIRIGGESLQKMVSTVYPYILDCFKHKAILFYKTEKPVLMSLPSAKQYVEFYSCVEDIVRHPTKVGRT